MVRNLLSATLMVAMLTGLQACVVYDEPGRPDRPDVVIRHDDNDYWAMQLSANPLNVV